MNILSASGKLSALTDGVVSAFSRLALHKQSAHSSVPRTPVSSEEGKSSDPEFRQMAFTMAVISLSAKLARVDGKITVEEFLAFRELFPMQEHLSSKIRDMFMAACNDAAPFEHFARQVVLLFPGRDRLFAELMDRLFQIAVADGAINAHEREFLRSVSGILGFNGFAFGRLMAKHSTPATVDPYKILGVTPKSSDEEIKRAYRRLMREHHPDGLQAYGVTDELVALCQKKVVAMNEAYDLIQRQRGLKRTPK